MSAGDLRSARLRVALDGRPLQREPLGGVGRFMAGTIPILAEHVELAVLLDGRQPMPHVRLDARVKQVALSAPPGVPGLGWLELAVAPWLRRFRGVFHATFNTLPLTFARRTVLTLHDLAPQLHAEDFDLARRAAWRFWVRGSVSRAAAITTVSEFVRRQIVGYFRVDPARVLVSPDACDPVFDPTRAGGARELTSRLGIDGPYVVAVGGANRRGLPTAIAAWRQATRRLGRHVPMAVLGEPELRPEPGLVSLGRLDDESWATVLAGAEALCYPTRYEGFGLPALEAAASGTPVVCAPVASLPEILGEAGCWAAAPSADAIADVLFRLLTDERWHRERREAGLERARQAPSFTDSAAALLDAYERAAA